MSIKEMLATFDPRIVLEYTSYMSIAQVELVSKSYYFMLIVFPGQDILSIL